MGSDRPATGGEATGSAPPDATASRVVAAAPEVVWEAVTDLGSIRSRSPETFAARWTRGSGPAAGARFRGWNRHGPIVWSTMCTVTEAEPGHSFAFAVTSVGRPVATWRWDLEPSDGATRVTLSTWDRRGPAMRVLGRVGTGVRDRSEHNRQGMEETLRRLADALA